MMKYFENQPREVAEVEISASAKMAILWPERVWREMGSSSGGDIGARYRVKWYMGLAYRGWFTLVGWSV